MTKRVEKALNLVSQMNDLELQQTLRAVNERYNYLASLKAMAFSIGDRVTFKGKWGKKVIGTVKKINQKTINVREDGELGLMWRVSASLLKRVK